MEDRQTPAKAKTMHSCAFCETLDGQDGWMPLDHFWVAKNWLFISSLCLNKFAIFRGCVVGSQGNAGFYIHKKPKSSLWIAPHSTNVPGALAASLRI